jgi:hypothetical protein
VLVRDEGGRGGDRLLQKLMLELMLELMLILVLMPVQGNTPDSQNRSVSSVSTPPPARPPSLCFTIMNRGLQCLGVNVCPGWGNSDGKLLLHACGPVALMPIAAFPPLQKFPDPGIPAPACTHSPAAAHLALSLLVGARNTDPRFFQRCRMCRMCRMPSPVDAPRRHIPCASTKMVWQLGAAAMCWWRWHQGVQCWRSALYS